MSRRIGLAFDPVALAARARICDAHHDEDLEAGAWPEIIDQTRLAAAMRGRGHEDDEEADCEMGIEDGPHDAFDEDGI